VPPERQLRFFGFDMQFPGTAMDTVRAYVQRVDAPKATFVDSSYACLAPYRNRGRAAAPAQYATLAVLPRSLSRASIAAVAGMLDGGRARYEPLGEDAFARARQSARLVAQWEDMSQAPPARRSALRDFYMAENARWQLERLPAGAKMVVWAHNAHVANATEMMGKHLRTALGPSYVAVGFAFGRGSFNAVAAPTSGSSGRGLRAHSTSHVPEGSFDDYFRAVGMPRFIVDARRIASSPAAAPLASPLKLRSIGAMFAPGREHLYFYPVQLPREYDLLIYFDRATESTLLPFRAG
jgi:erythromycin esterase